MVVADLEPKWWKEIFGSLPELVFITKLNHDEVHYFDGEELERLKYRKIFEAIGQEPEFDPVMHFNLKLLSNYLLV
jgi:ssDNA-specific exonuclease RecJ